MQVQTEIPTKEDFFQEFIKGQVGKGVQKEKVPSFYNWVNNSNLIVDGRPFTYKKHEYLKPVYRDEHPFIVWMKAAQGGATLWAILRTIYKSRYKNIRGALYLFPSRTDVSDFAKGRVDPIIDENPDNIGQWIRDTDATNIKRIWNSFLYLRGMKSKIGLKSIPADLIVFDELDEAIQSMIDVAMERMAHSEDGGEVIMLSNPTLPEYGVDKAFSQTDQRYWFIKCSRCNEYHNLVDEFPNCFVEKRTGEVIRVCVKCGKELNPSKGQYVAKRPDITDKRGYHYSQLYSQFPASEPKKILHLFKTTSNMREFYNLKIGVPFAGKFDSLSVEEVLALCDTYGLVSSDPGPCYMGVDQGKNLHVVIGKWQEHKLGKIIYLGIHTEFSELDTLMNHFNISRCVIDWEPNIHESRRFAERFRGRVFCHKYNEFYRGPYKWDEEKLKITTNRTDSLDASAFEIQSGEIILPSKQLEIVKTFAAQLHNIIKKLEIEKDEDGVETGNKRFVYVRRGEDHFRHAFNYETMARQYTLDLAFPWMQ